jgi:glycosyltransferase involved in cell wall biosynthesis
MLQISTNFFHQLPTTGPGKFGRRLAEHLIKYDIEFKAMLQKNQHGVLACHFLPKQPLSFSVCNNLPIIQRIGSLGVGVDNYYNIHSGLKGFQDYDALQNNYRMSQHIIFQTEFAKRTFVEHTGLDNKPFDICMNGIKPNNRIKFKEKKPILFSACWNWSNGREIFPLYVIKAMKMLSFDIPDIKYIIVGNTHSLVDKMQRINEVVPDYPDVDLDFINRHVELRPFIADPNELDNIKRQSAIFMHLVRYDACPNTVIESMNSGLPCIGHEDSGSTEIIGGAGYVVPVREGAPKTAQNCDIDVLAFAISGLLNNQEMFFERVRERVNTVLNIENVAKKYAEIIQNVLR